MSDRLFLIDRLAREQHGLITLDQLLKLADEHWIGRRVVAGQLIRIAPRVYRLCGAKKTWEMRAMGAVLSCRAPALVSHRSAAYLYGLDGCRPTGFVDITVPHHRRPKKRAGVSLTGSSIGWPSGRGCSTGSR